MSLFNSFTLSVSRKAPGDYVQGKWVDGAESTFPIQCTYQPARGAELQTLPEGRRIEVNYKIYTATQLRTADQKDKTVPDRVTGPDNNIYEVIDGGNYQNGLINHYKYFLVRAKEEAA